MIDQKKRTYHFETASLLPLKLLLTEAKKDAPPQTLKELSDTNEELALNLIASMKKGLVIARSVGCDEAIPNTSRRLLRREEHLPRNDIKLEA